MSATGALVASVDVDARQGPPHHRNKMTMNESRSRVNFFIAREKRIEEEGPEKHEARMEAIRLRRFGPARPVPGVVGGIGSAMEDAVLAVDDAVVVAAPLPPVVVAAPPQWSRSYLPRCYLLLVISK